MKKCLSLVLALALVFSFSIPAFAAGNFPDSIYVDIGKVLDASKTFDHLEAYESLEDGQSDLPVQHVSGTVYSVDLSYMVEENVFYTKIHYTDGTSTNCDIQAPEEADAGKDLFTFETRSGTWSVYAGLKPEAQNVTGKYADGYDGGVIYKVDISWGSMAFTYTAASKGTWNAGTHVYDNPVAAKWTCDEDANKITVTNHSNSGISVTPVWAADSGYSAVSMTFQVNDADAAKLALATADNGENGAAGSATSGTITVTPTGDLPKDTDGKIGAITLQLAGSTTVVSLKADKNFYSYMVDPEEPSWETLEDVTFTVTYGDGSTQSLAYNAEGLTLTPQGEAFDQNKNGEYRYTASYGGATCEFTMSVYIGD